MVIELNIVWNVDKLVWGNLFVYIISKTTERHWETMMVSGHSSSPDTHICVVYGMSCAWALKRHMLG